LQKATELSRKSFDAFFEFKRMSAHGLWGWSELSGYACPYLSGLIRDCYLQRWSQQLEAGMRGERFSTKIWSTFAAKSSFAGRAYRRPCCGVQRCPAALRKVNRVMRPIFSVSE
jgi:hypothetical protein